MPYKTPKETTAAAVVAGTAKANPRLDRILVGSFLAGAYVAFAGLLSIAVSSGLDIKTWGTLPTLISGSVFTVGLVLVVLTGSDLLTGNMALVPMAMLRRKVSFGRLSVNFTVVLIGNLLGSLFVAYFMAIQSGVIGSHGAEAGTAASLTYDRLAGIAKGKALTETDYQIFLRAVGCNWLVCLAVWLALAAEDIAGKILAIFFPIMAFVAMGFDHVVANMFFLPAAMYAHMPGLGWHDVLDNWVFAFLGNLVGAVVFVAVAHWYLHLHGEPDPAAAGTADSASSDGASGKRSLSRASQPTQ